MLKKKHLIICCFSNQNRHRVQTILKRYNVYSQFIENIQQLETLDPAIIAISVLPIENGFESNDYIFVSEQILFGVKTFQSSISKKSHKKNSDALLKNITSIKIGDLIVHKEYGIAKFNGIINLKIGNSRHDCFFLVYAGEDKLYVPVENINLLSYYGASEIKEGQRQLVDKLGSANWQSRKAKLKKRIEEIADELMKTAAQRTLTKAPTFDGYRHLLQEFNSEFQFVETEDQLKTLQDIENDLQSGKPMDRLVCGDVGFGKTEIAMRASFIFCANKLLQKESFQIAFIVPTTLLAKQHFESFSKRFANFNLKIALLSRMVTVSKQQDILTEVQTGKIDILIGTHALLSKKIQFANLGLLIVDEEQHFGVKQKEKLKNLKSNLHILTLSATPIPRTLQLSLTGIRDLSLLTTPPTNRIAIINFVMQFDDIIIREAIIKERNRGGRIFFVCPKIKDLAIQKEHLMKLVPNLKMAIAHGKIPAIEIDNIMNDFYEGKYDLLLTTTIIESGIDFPLANTIIIHRSDMFGMSQLYQLRGRVGRSNVQAYAYFTFEKQSYLTNEAKQRLESFSQFNDLGANFQLASMDMEIRGTGNLLGQSQSGQIKEVGVELYHHMLEEAVAVSKEQQQQKKPINDSYTPKINIDIPVFISTDYIENFKTRLEFYKRISDITSINEADIVSAELIDRFGEIPIEIKNLIEISLIKYKSIQSNIENLNIGNKAMSISFRNNYFKNTEELLKLIQNDDNITLKTDSKLFINFNRKNDHDSNLISNITLVNNLDLVFLIIHNYLDKLNNLCL